MIADTLGYSYEPLEGSPRPQRGPALQIAVEDARVEAGRLRFDLLIAHALSLDFASSFERVSNALVAVLRDETTGRGAALRLIDDCANPLVPIERNFVDQRTTPPAPMTVFGFLNLTVRVELGELPPRLRVYVVLQDLLSNELIVEPE